MRPEQKYTKVIGIKEVQLGLRVHSMKFGRNLPRNVVPEWSSSYINYKALKKLIKSAADSQEAQGDVDLVGKLLHPIFRGH